MANRIESGSAGGSVYDGVVGRKSRAIQSEKRAGENKSAEEEQLEDALDRLSYRLNGRSLEKLLENYRGRGSLLNALL